MNYFDQITQGAEENILLLLDENISELSQVAKKSLFKRNVEIVNLELSYLCNRKCDYCPVAHSTRQVKQDHMADFVFEKICNELNEIRFENRISLNLYNEPLLDDSLEEKISLIRKKLPFCHIGFNSNGDKLNFNRLKKISDAGCNSICVTLHPLPHEVLDNEAILKRVSKLYEKLKMEKLFFLDVVEKNNIEFRSLGVNIKIQWPDWRTQGTSRAGILIEHISKRFKRTQPCAKPFREFTIYYDGKVQPCCEAFHDESKNTFEVGDLARDSIFDVYVSKNMNNFRQSLYDFSLKIGICKNCNVIDHSRLEEDPFRKSILSKMKIKSE